MIRLYYHPTPNPAKVALFLEETGMPYETVPVDTARGQQHTPEYLAINPNGKVPAMVDTEGAGGETRVFDSSAMILYLAEKSGQFLGTPADRGELLSWLFWIASGLGPFSGQSVHFQRAAPEKLAYPIKRYRFEAERHYRVLDRHLDGREFIVGGQYTIADMSAWGWVDRVNFVLPNLDGGDTHPLVAFPNIHRWFQAIDARPAAQRARKVGTEHAFTKGGDEESKRHLYPSMYATAAE